MIHHYNRRQARQRLIIIACFGLALFAAIALYNSATAQSSLLLRIWHDQDSSASVTAGDIVADGVIVTITEIDCTGQVCAASPNAWSVTTDADGYAAITLHDGSYEIAAPCMVATVAAADVSGQGVTEWATCARGVWLAAIHAD